MFSYSQTGNILIDKEREPQKKRRWSLKAKPCTYQNLRQTQRQQQRKCKDTSLVKRECGIKEEQLGVRRQRRQRRYISIPLGWAGDRRYCCSVPCLCCQCWGQPCFSTCDWTTDTGINSLAAELRADQWKVFDALQRLHFLQREKRGGFDQYPLCEGCRHGRLMAI